MSAVFTIVPVLESKGVVYLHGSTQDVVAYVGRMGLGETVVVCGNRAVEILADGSFNKITDDEGYIYVSDNRWFEYVAEEDKYVFCSY